MKSLAIAPLLAASAVALPELSLSKRDRHTNGATSHFRRAVNLEARSGGTLTTNVFDVLSWSEGGAYYVNVSVGTPPQPQTVILDTGSSDLYFDTSSASQCQETGAYACKGGTFNPSDSSTYKIVEQSPAFNTSFGDGSTASGPYSTDVLEIGDVSISHVQFGVAEEVDSTTGFAIGLMGVGYSIIEATEQQYANVPEVLVDAGVINSRLYSVFLNDENDFSGSILFGGIDTTKYEGDLATLDLLPTIFNANTAIVAQFITTVTGVSATVSGKTKTLFANGTDGIEAYGRSDSALPVLLDTGSTAWTVPTSYWEKYFQPIFSFVGQNGIVPCSYANTDDYLTVEFGAKVSIKVPYREFIVPIINSTTQQPYYFTENEEACAFLIQPPYEGQANPEGFETLGDAILRSMYVVFDLDNGQVSIGQAALGTSQKPNVVTVAAGPSGVAKAVSGVQTAAKNTWTIAPAAPTNNGNSYSVSTLQSTLGTATGINAIPTAARASGEVVASGPSAQSGDGSAASHTPTPGVAAGLVVPPASSSSLLVTGLTVFFAALGAGLMM